MSNHQITIDEYRTSFQKKTTLQYKVFELLSDQQWHCRNCEGNVVGSQQYAGGGGIQGLQRGTNSRPGIEILTKNEYCEACEQKRKWDKWTGSFKASSSASSMPKKLQQKIFDLYSKKDVIEQRERPTHELVIDHRFPMSRWEGAEEKLSEHMTDQEIRKKFQLLKKDAAGNHNLLKSRACEKCAKTGERGTPFGIIFWYEGSQLWDKNIPSSGTEAENGCIGCGWYDFGIWREALNEELNSNDSPN